MSNVQGAFTLGYLIALLRDCEDPMGLSIGVSHALIENIIDDCEQFLAEHPESSNDPSSGELFWLTRNGRLKDITWLVRNSRLDISQSQSQIETARHFGPCQLHIDLEDQEVSCVSP